MKTASGKKASDSAVIAVCGNPNCGKTTIFNAMTGLNQQVGNYPGVTVDKVVGQFRSPTNNNQKINLIDIPGTYSLSAFTPDEYIAASALFGEIEGDKQPDGVIVVLDATNLERSLYFLLQIIEIGCPIVVALNMVDLVKKRGLRIDTKRLSKLLGVEIVEVIGNRGVGIDLLSEKAAELLNKPFKADKNDYGRETEDLISYLSGSFSSKVRSRAQYMRVIFDVNGEAEKKFIAEEGSAVVNELLLGRAKIKNEYGALTVAETYTLTSKAHELFNETVASNLKSHKTRSERLDKILLHPFWGPIILIVLMMVVFQSIFSWAEPFMEIIDSFFSSISGIVENNLAEGPLRSLLTDGIIGGVGSVLIFIPQIAFLFFFIALLEDSGYMPRAAFIVDRMFRWCGLSGKSFIPMLSSFACAVPGIMATRTIEDRKLRMMTIIISPLMTCSARLPVYTIMIAAFIPYHLIFGFVNLQGIVLSLLYLLGIVMAVIISFILKKTVFKTERGTFIMEMPSYKVPMLKSIFIRVTNRVKSFILRAGTVIMAITIVIWALSYYPRSEEVVQQINQQTSQLEDNYNILRSDIVLKINNALTNNPSLLTRHQFIIETYSSAQSLLDLQIQKVQLIAQYPEAQFIILNEFEIYTGQFELAKAKGLLVNRQAGMQIRNSYFGIMGRVLEPAFKPLGWDWKITMSVLASFPAREVIIAILGTIYNLGADVDEESSSLIEKMRQAKWEDGEKIGQPVFTPAVALSIMVFFALCCQCGATLVTIKQETNSWIYPSAVFLYMTILAYVSALVVYQLFNGLGM